MLFKVGRTNNENRATLTAGYNSIYFHYFYFTYHIDYNNR
jgi:hypothetical protein